MKIPTSWKNMVNYRENFYKIVQNDEKFFTFLSNYKTNTKSDKHDLPFIVKKNTNLTNTITNNSNEIESKSNHLGKSENNFLNKDRSCNNLLYNSSFISSSNMSKDMLKNISPNSKLCVKKKS